MYKKMTAYKKSDFEADVGLSYDMLQRTQWFLSRSRIHCVTQTGYLLLLDCLDLGFAISDLMFSIISLVMYFGFQPRALECIVRSREFAPSTLPVS